MEELTKNYTLKELEELGKEEQREYYREYRKKNKEKVADINKRYWIRRALRNKES